MARPKKEVITDVLKKTVVVEKDLNRLISVAASLEGLSESDYIVKVVRENIPNEVRELVKRHNKE